MKPIAKIICCGIALGWLQGAAAGDVTVSEQNGSIVLELVAAPPDAVQPASAPAGIVPPVQAQSEQGATPGVAPVTRVPVKVHYERVDRANIEKRMDARAARTKKRKADAEKDVAERAAKAKLKQPNEQGRDTQGQ
ncbi:MAG TPA: hypothetical protein VFF26_07130 [Gallionella sp.]|nr:hypothetical protein [Gallionella sp.]